MKLRAILVLLSVLVFAAGGPLQANPPAPILGWPPPPMEPVKLEGPYRLHLSAQCNAVRRLSQGYYALPLERGGRWWVAYYPLFREPSPPYGP